jgi:hypothetical protein
LEYFVSRTGNLTGEMNNERLFYLISVTCTQVEQGVHFIVIISDFQYPATLPVAATNSPRQNFRNAGATE